MKTKIDFVTNSSCASFVIQKKFLTELQMFQIKNHGIISKEFLGDEVEIIDEWNITETSETIEGDTFMDNFDMLWFLTQIGVDDENIEYHGCYE